MKIRDTNLVQASLEMRPPPIQYLRGGRGEGGGGGGVIATSDAGHPPTLQNDGDTDPDSTRTARTAKHEMLGVMKKGGGCTSRPLNPCTVLQTAEGLLGLKLTKF